MLIGRTAGAGMKSVMYKHITIQTKGFVTLFTLVDLKTLNSISKLINKFIHIGGFGLAKLKMSHLFVDLLKWCSTGEACRYLVRLDWYLSERLNREEVVVGSSEVWCRHEGEPADLTLGRQLTVLTTALWTEIASAVQLSSFFAVKVAVSGMGVNFLNGKFTTKDWTYTWSYGKHK